MSASLVSNCSACVGPLDRALSSAQAMLEARAFVHQYTEHGMEQADFLAAFARVRDAVAAYQQL